MTTDPEPDAKDGNQTAGDDRGREAPLPWVPFVPDPALRPVEPASFADAFTVDAGEIPRRRHPAQRTVSMLVVVAMGLVIASGAVVIATRSHPPAHPITRDSPSSSAPTPTPTDSAQQLAAVAASDLPEIVMVVAVGTTSEELGTAWPLDAAGDFLTNDHVVHMGQSFHVVLGSGQQYAAEVINDDPQLDLAEIHVWDLREQPLPIDDALPPIGQPVVVLAAQGATGHSPVTESKVNGLNESATVNDAKPGELSDYTGLIRIPARIFPGNSGGPMITPQGEVVGILTLAAETGSGAFAIPITQVDQVIQTWLAG
ncbi:MAG: S1C family serine protease [Candidatus Dormiibacterota bacterium]